jgi:hypothetical protein
MAKRFHDDGAVPSRAAMNQLLTTAFGSGCLGEPGRRPSMHVSSVIRTMLAVVGLLAVIVAGAVAWLYATPPQPRAAEAWQLGPPLPTSRGELAMAVAQAEPCATPLCTAERLYVIGGLSGLFTPETGVSIYDPNRKVWSAGPPLPAPRHHLAAVGLGSSIYASGGTDVSGLNLGHKNWPPRDNFWRLAVGSSQWEDVGPMIEPRWGHRLVAHDGRLYVVGGRGPSGRVLIYAPGKGWTAGADIPRPRDHLSVVVADGRIWAIGGRDPRSLTRVDIYDPATDSWQSGLDLPAPTSGAAEGVIDGIIYVYGGEEPSFVGGGVTDQHWMLNTRSETRRWEPAPAPPLAVHGSHGAVLQGAFVIAGGATRHGALSIVGWSDALQVLARPAIARR